MELEQRFADAEACRQYLFGLRWPQGFECSAYGGRGVWKGSRNRLLCTSCRRQIYILAGTVFQDSHLPLTLWFRAMWHLTSQKNGISALGLQRELGIGSYKTAWRETSNPTNRFMALAPLVLGDSIPAPT